MLTNPSDIEVKLKTDQGRAIIEGKTTIPFQTFVTLVLQRKVFSLFKQWGREPVILGSELLTSLASAPQDSQENRTNLILVTLGVGILAGVFLFALTQILLSSFGVTLTMQEFALIAGGLLVLALLSSTLTKMKRVRRGEKVAETMEKLTGLLSK